MANYYFHPTADQGTGSGDSKANAKAFTNSALATAEGSISSGDTIYFDTSATYVVVGALDFCSSQTAKEINYKTTDGSKAEFTCTTCHFGNASLVSLLSYENIDITASATTDPVVLYQSASDIRRLQTFTTCLFDAVLFFEDTGMLGCPRANFTGCIFSQNSNKYFFDHRRGSSTSDCQFTNCVITNRFSGTGLRVNIFRRVNATLKNCIILDTTNYYTTLELECTVTVLPYNSLIRADGTSLSSDANNLAVLPQFVDPANGDYRLRPNSPGIRKTERGDQVYIKPGSGTGTGTEDDPYYWSQYSSAFSDAVTTTSKTVLYEDGQYIVSAVHINDSNIGNNITHESKNRHGAEFTNTSRMTPTQRPTLKIKNFKMTLVDHWIFDTFRAHDFDLDGCLVYWQKYGRFRDFKARGTVFSQDLGFNGSTASQFLYASTMDIETCTIVDPNNSSNNAAYSFIGLGSGTINKTIFYSAYPRTATVVASSLSVTMTDCAGQNVPAQTGIAFLGDVQFVDSANEDYRLRPASPLISISSASTIAGAVYIQPGTGTGAGTKADPYYYSQLNTAETDAGSGGTIIFTDGTYSVSGNQTWDKTQVTYESENLHGAIIDGGPAIRQLIFKHNTIKKFHFKMFQFFRAETADGGTANLQDLKVVNDTAFAVGNNPGFFGGRTTGNHNTYTRCEFFLNVSGSTGTDNRFVKSGAGVINLTWNECSFYLNTSGLPANALRFDASSATLVFKNTIMAASDSGKFQSSFAVASNGTNCCIHNIDHNTSGGTDNVFSDPLYVDTSTGDLRLKPSSPCIGAGTSS